MGRLAHGARGRDQEDREPGGAIVYSSNALAILGLRSLYILLDQLIGELRYLHYGLAAVLAFAGLKMITGRWFEIPAALSIGIIVACIGAAVWPSVRALRREARQLRAAAHGAT